MDNGMENDSESFVGSDDGYILLKWGEVIIKCYVGVKNFKKCNMTPLQ